MARQIVVELIGDPKKFTKTMDDAAKSADGFGNKMKSVGKAVAVGAGLMAAAVVATGVEVFKMGAQFEAMDAKAQTVFGDSLKTVETWADKNAQAMGLTKRSAIGLAASMGDLLVPMGFTREAAAEMSTGIVGLSGALSEWTGGTKSATEVSDILTKALLGERDGLKALGISITEADVSAQLLKNGQDQLTGAALEQAKALATQELIMAKTTDAQAAYEKGTAKGIRAQNEMNATIGEVVETLVTSLYPIVLKVAQFLKENLPRAIQFAKEAWVNIGPAIKTIIGFLMDVAKVVIPAVVTVVGTLVNAFKQHWPTISGAVSSAMKVIVPVVQTIIGIIVKVGTTAADIVGKVIKSFTDIVKFVQGVPGKIASGLSNLFSPLWTGFKKFINYLIAGWNSLKFSIPKVDLGPLGVIGGFSIGTPNIPYLHSGGVVPGLPGSNVPAILQAGEVVVPRKYAGQAGNVTVNFYGPVYGDDMEDLARKLAMRLRTVGG